jgi:hypothetical protein
MIVHPIDREGGWTMAEDTKGATRLSLAEVEAHFGSWREGRRRGARIPAQLWDEARGLHPRHSIYAISRALRLDYVDVRDRIAGKKGRARREQAREQGAVRFVALPPVGGTLIGECRIVAGDSEQGGLKIELRNVGAGELAALIVELRSQGL